LSERDSVRYVGVDSAYRTTGVVILDHAGQLVRRVALKCPSKRDPDGLLWWRDVIDEVIEPGDVVGLEGLSFGSTGRAHILSGVYALWQMAAIERGRYLFVVPPIRAKLWATQNAKADKVQMIAWASQYFALHEMSTWEIPKVTEHEADALALALVAQVAYDAMQDPGRVLSLPKYRQEALINRLGTGVIQAEDKAFYRGRYGQD
jgi:Holliday junction resolvasome RuvABC endonuclease subunit